MTPSQTAIAALSEVVPIYAQVGDQIPDVTLTEGQPEYGKGARI